MKRRFSEFIYRSIKNFIEWIKISPKPHWYRGAPYDEEMNIDSKRQQGNTKMSYRGISYTLLNSEIKVKNK